MTRSTFPLIYQGLSCARHRCADRLVETHECVECVGPARLREMEQRSEQQEQERRVHRVLHEMSDGGKTTLQLVHTTGLSTTQLRPLLEQLASSGMVRFGEERLGHHSRWLWSLLPPAAAGRGHQGSRPSPRPLGSSRPAGSVELAGRRSDLPSARRDALPSPAALPAQRRSSCR